MRDLCAFYVNITHNKEYRPKITICIQYMIFTYTRVRMRGFMCVLCKNNAHLGNKSDTEPKKTQYLQYIILHYARKNRCICVIYVNIMHFEESNRIQSKTQYIYIPYIISIPPDFLYLFNSINASLYLLRKLCTSCFAVRNFSLKSL